MAMPKSSASAGINMADITPPALNSIQRSGSGWCLIGWCIVMSIPEGDEHQEHQQRHAGPGRVMRGGDDVGRDPPAAQVKDDGLRRGVEEGDRVEEKEREAHNVQR